MSDPFVSQLATLCSNSPTAPKWVIVPTHALGHTVGDRLVLEGTNWVNLRFKTPFDLALEIAGPYLAERGIDPAADDSGPALMMRLLRELPEGVPSFVVVNGETVASSCARRSTLLGSLVRPCVVGSQL